MNQWKNILILLTISILIQCGTTPEIHYYQINNSLQPLTISDAQHQSILGIAKFKADQLYDSDRIVYRDSPYEVKFYNYHRWIIPPKEIVTQKVYEQFTNSKLFKQVVFFPHVSKIDYLLRGTIKAFEEIDEKDGWFALVKIHFELVNMNDNNLIWQATLAQRTTVAPKKPVEVVHSLDISLQKCIQQAITEISRVLEK